MLVLFRFKNYGPFKEETVFDMRAISSYKEHQATLITVTNGSPLLKTAAIYGANASGKSNFVDAYRYFLGVVKDSFSKNNKEKDESVLESYHYPFLFDDVSCDKETEFEAVYYYGDTEYRYGFSYNKLRIETEWLYKRSLSSGRQSRIIERTKNNITLGSSVKRSCEKYLKDIDSDVLALSFLSSLKLRTHVFTETAYCISDILPLSLAYEDHEPLILKKYFEKDFNDAEKPKLLSFLKSIDIGIKDIIVEKNSGKIDVTTFHVGENGKLYSLPFNIESDGTKRAIAIYSLIRIATLYDKGLLIDEFNSQLHPLLQKYLITLFSEESRCGQLVYTTHDTLLLDKQFTRRDQVWFTSKDDSGCSSLYSLAEYKIRNDRSFGKDYLGGVYGGIPILTEFSFKEE